MLCQPRFNHTLFGSGRKSYRYLIFLILESYAQDTSSNQWLKMRYVTHREFHVLHDDLEPNQAKYIIYSSPKNLIIHFSIARVRGWGLRFKSLKISFNFLHVCMWMYLASIEWLIFSSSVYHIFWWIYHSLDMHNIVRPP